MSEEKRSQKEKLEKLLIAPEIVGFKKIKKEEFYKLHLNEGLRLFDYYQEDTQFFYKKE